MNPCPEPTKLQQLLDAQLSEAEQQALEPHLRECTVCQNTLTHLAEDDDLERWRLLSRKDPSAAGALQAVGKYPLVRELARDGQAVVYLARHPTLGKEVVIKLSRRKLAGRPNERDLLVQEGQLLAQLKHPNLIHVEDLDVHDNHPFLVLEYVPGRNLEQVVQQQPLPPRAAALLVAKVARALAVVHQRGVLHLDIKPRNILIDAAGEPRLIDFGIASLRDAWTGGGVQLSGGTPAFMPPEQARAFSGYAQNGRKGDPVDERSDLFGLGAVLYSLLVNKPPFSGGNTNEVLARAAACDFDRSALDAAPIPRRLRTICLKAMNADPAQRYARAEDLARDLEALRKPHPALLVSAVAVLVLAFLGGWWVLGLLTRPAAPQMSRPGEASPLQVQVRRQEHVLDLKSALALRTGRDRVRIECKIPHGSTAAMFLFNSAGELHRLAAEVSPGDDFDKIIFPPLKQGPVNFTPPSGVEFILVCAARSPTDLTPEIEKLFRGRQPLPSFSPHVLVRLDPNEVTVESPTRGLGSSPEEQDAVGKVEEYLNQLRLKLREQVPFFQGVALSHQE